MIPGIILLVIAAVAVFAGASVTSVLGVQALSMVIYTGALGFAIRRKWPSGAVFETVASHKWCGNAAIFLMFIHVVAAIVTDPIKSRYFFTFEAPPPGAAGIASITMALITFGLGYYRKHVNMLPSYRWKTFHGLTALLSVLFAMAHLVWLNNLIYSPVWQLVFALLLIGSAAMVAVRLRE